jgi:hypothetical protein
MRIFIICSNINLAISPFQLNITEKNAESYLSAGEIPLPPLYFALCIVFLFTGCFWFYVLRKSK